MTDTIDLLESIGRDASLRRASPGELEHALEQMQASDSLKRAAASGQATLIKTELGTEYHQVVQSPPPGPTPSNQKMAMTPPPPPEKD